MSRTLVASARALALLCLLWSGCSAASEPEESPVDDGGASAWLMQVRSAHGRADAALALGDATSATEALRRALDASVPRAMAAEDARVVQQDLLYRLAGIELDRGRAQQALQACERGLSLGASLDSRRADAPGTQQASAQELFRANLLILRGEALQAVGRDSEAAASYYEALEINRALLGSVLDGLDAQHAPDAGDELDTRDGAKPGEDMPTR